jgi:PTH2 family peptidyl-tRNA hydrolase
MKQVIVMIKELKLSKGKMAAQACHAAIGAYKLTKAKYPNIVRAWEENGEKKVLVYVEKTSDLFELFKRIPDEIPKVMITDAGKTQLEPGTITCLGLGPYHEDELDRYTGKLKLVG